MLELLGRELIQRRDAGLETRCGGGIGAGATGCARERGDLARRARARGRASAPAAVRRSAVVTWVDTRSRTR